MNNESSKLAMETSINDGHFSSGYDSVEYIYELAVAGKHVWPQFLNDCDTSKYNLGQHAAHVYYIKKYLELTDGRGNILADWVLSNLSIPSRST